MEPLSIPFSLSTTRDVTRMHIDIVTIFPDMVEVVLGTSMLKIAREKGLVSYGVHDLRSWAQPPHDKVDDRPFGGGPGMVMKPEPIVECLEDVLGADLGSVPIYALTPQGRTWRQNDAWEASRGDRIALLCGHYEGFDERIFSILPITEVSIGDYVLTQGELPALVLLDTVVRLRPGVLGDEDSIRHESFNEGLLDHPHFTRPVAYRGHEVPEVLRSGHHGEIEAWRRQAALEKTRARRPDLRRGEAEGGTEDDVNR